jgi:hypothetical protein
LTGLSPNPRLEAANSHRKGCPVEAQETPITAYEKPRIVDYGDLVELTAGTSSGNYLDADFAAGTPYGDLTFSSTP